MQFTCKQTSIDSAEATQEDQKSLTALGSHHIAQHDRIIINSYDLFIIPTCPSDQLKLSTDFIISIQHLIDFITTHINNLRGFHYDPEQTNPIDIAVRNREEFFIDSILEHRGNHQ